MELLLLGIFAAALLLCVFSGISIIYAMILGLVLFFAYGLVKKKTWKQMLVFSWQGVKTAKNILLTFLLIQLLVRWLDLLARLPIISGLNKIAGALLGLAHGLLLLWVACLLLDLFSATPLGSALMEQVEESSWLTFLYQYNLLGFLLRGILNSIL